MDKKMINEIVGNAFQFLFAFANHYRYEKEDSKALAFRFAYFVWTSLLAFADEEDCATILDAVNAADLLYSQISANPATFGAWLVKESVELGTRRLVFSMEANPELKSEFKFLDELCLSQDEPF